MSLRFNLSLEQATLRYLFTAYSQATEKVLIIISLTTLHSRNLPRTFQVLLETLHFRTGTGAHACKLSERVRFFG